LAAHAASTHHIALRELPAAALLGAHASHPALRVALEHVAQADVVLVATPIYKAAYSGLLKVFLDLLPSDGLRGKQVLALATGGSASHLLAIDYSLKPVLNALGARHLLDAVYATENQLAPHETLGHVPDAALVERLERSLLGLFDVPQPRARMPSLRAPALPC
jgi:FMN reductase